MRHVFLLFIFIACTIPPLSHAAEPSLAEQAQQLADGLRMITPYYEIIPYNNAVRLHQVIIRDSENRILLILKLLPAAMADTAGILDVIKAHMKYAPQTAAILGLPFPPKKPIYIELGYPDGNFAIPRGAFINNETIASIGLNMDYFNPSSLVHELGHAMTQNTYPERYSGLNPWCAGRRLSETESQLPQIRLFPETIPRDLASLTVALNAVPRKNQDTYVGNLLRQYLMATDYIGYDYAFGWLLGDAMIAKMGLGKDADVGPIIRRIMVAKNMRTLENTVSALDFETFDELNDAVGTAYLARMDAIRANPVTNNSFIKCFLEEKANAEWNQRRQARLSVTQPASPLSDSWNSLRLGSPELPPPLQLLPEFKPAPLTPFAPIDALPKPSLLIDPAYPETVRPANPLLVPLYTPRTTTPRPRLRLPLK